VPSNLVYLDSSVAIRTIIDVPNASASSPGWWTRRHVWVLPPAAHRGG